MSLSGRLFSLRPRLAHATSLSLRPQRRGLNEFITSASVPANPLPQDSFRLAIKDNIATGPQDGKALATTCASRILASHQSPFEATIVRQLKRRGARVVGKTNLDEFGMGTHNINSAYGPVAQEVKDGATGKTIKFSAGGSSGGSALAVARGEADVALGTDTGGSVRLPAAYCGVVGYKPSYGMISRHGVVPYANSLDTVGFLARDVRTIQELVLGGGLHDEHDPHDPTSLSHSARARCTESREFYSPQLYLSQQQQPAGEASELLLRPLTFGIPVEYNIAELSGRVRDAWEEAARVLREDVGARVVPVSLASTRHALSAYYIIAPAEASSNLAKYDGVRYGAKQPDIEGDLVRNADHVLYSAVRGNGFGAEVKRRILLGSYTLSSEAIDNYFMQAQRVRHLVRRDFEGVFKLANPLRDEADQQLSLADLDEKVALENKLGPTQVDFLLCPTAPDLAPRLDAVEQGQQENPVDAYTNDVLTVPASLAGLPAISIPRNTVSASRPADGSVGDNVMGLQVIGQYWDDARLLAVADALMARLKR